jgi:arylsulfatase A-like enzyme
MRSTKDSLKLAFGITLAGLGITATAGNKPNVIIIYADDLGYGDLSCYGGVTPTPNIDRIGHEGIRFTDFYVASPVCTPSRYGLLTGSYPMRSMHGLEEVGMPGDDISLDKSETILPQYLKQAGYSTAIFGKWHMGAIKPEYFPHKHGFDQFIGFTVGCTDYFTHNYGSMGNDWYKNGELTKEKGYSTDLITDHALEYIKDKRKTGSPYFLYLAYNAPHYGKSDPSDLPDSTLSLKKGNYKAAKVMNSLQAKPEDLKKFKNISNPYRRFYSAMVFSLDYNVGRILNELEKSGELDNTIIWFISDNGGYSQSFFGYASNGPLKAEKAFLYEGGIRIPSVLCWKGKIRNNQTISDPCCNVDVVPTLSKIIGFDITPNKNKIDGKDITPLILSGKKIDRDLFWRYKNSNQIAYRKGEWKIVNDELYNLSTDIGETTDLSGKYPEKFNEMKKSRSDIENRIKNQR